MIGILLVALIEYRDSSFKREEDVERLLKVRVLALIPEMAPAETGTEKRRLRLIMKAFAVLLLVGSAAVVAMWRLRF